MAACIFNKLARERGVLDVVAESAGTEAMSGMRATPMAVGAALRHDVDLRGHRSRPLTREVADAASLILTMTGRQWYDATELVSREKVALLPGFGRPDAQKEEILDPFGDSEGTYDETFERIEAEIGESFPWIAERARAMSGREP